MDYARLAACKTLASRTRLDARLAHSGGPREISPPARGRWGPPSGRIRPEWQHGTKARYKGSPSSPRRPGAAPPSAASGGARNNLSPIQVRWGKWIAFRTPDNWPVPHPRSRTPHPRRRFAAPPRQEEARTCVCTAEPGISARGARGKGLRTSNLCSLKPPKKGYDAPSPKTNREGSFVVPRASLDGQPGPKIRPRRYSASSTRRWTRV